MILLLFLLSVDIHEDVPLLGHDDYTVREQTSERLWKVLKEDSSIYQTSVEEQLAVYLTSTDPELRMRVGMLLYRLASTTDKPWIQKRVWRYLGVKYREVEHIPWNQMDAYHLTDEQWEDIIKSLPYVPHPSTADR